jgi:hypothetical protein
VYVNEDGSARKLDADEYEYLATGCHPADGARPYIKSRYDARAPDGRLAGFLQRDELIESVTHLLTCLAGASR